MLIGPPGSGIAHRPMLALLVALSLAGLVAGPLVVALGRRRALPAPALDGLTLGLVPALVLSYHLPHALEEIGAQALGWAALGYALLWLTERRQHHAGEAVGREVAFSALAVHGLLDGAGLALAAAAAAGAEGAHGMLFALAVVVHRLPEGLSLATRFLPAWGWRKLAARLGLLGALTLAGAALGQHLMDSLPHESFEGFIAFGLGVLLRLVIHTHDAPPRTQAARRLSAVTFLAGLLIALALPSPEDALAHAHPHELSITTSLGPLLVETAPAMLAGLLAAGLLRVLLQRQLTGWPRGGTALLQAVRGMAFGLPLRSRGVEPIARQLLRTGAPAAAVVAFAIGAPVLDVGSAMLSARLLGLPLAGVRVAGSVLLAVGVALLVARVAAQSAATPTGSPPAEELPAGEPPHAGELPAGEPPPAPLRAQLRVAVAEAVGPALDHVAAWYVAGIALAALLEAAIDPAAASALGAPADVIVSALLAIPVSVCALGATPLAAVMIHKGFSVGAALAFLLVGPATNLAVLAMLKRSLGARAAAAFALGSVAFAVALGLLANSLVPAASVPQLRDLLAHQHAAIEWLCAAALGVLLLSSFLRLGPRAWFGAMTARDDNAPQNEHDGVGAACVAHGHGPRSGAHHDPDVLRRAYGIASREDQPS